MKLACLLVLIKRGETVSRPETFANDANMPQDYNLSDKKLKIYEKEVIACMQ